MINVNEFASNKMRELRNKKGISQEELAEELGMKQQSIARYENNQREFKQKFLFQLAEYFGVSINEFFPPIDLKEEFDEYAILFNKYKELDEDDKELIKNIIETRKKQIDKELDGS